MRRLWNGSSSSSAVFFTSIILHTNHLFLCSLRSWLVEMHAPDFKMFHQGGDSFVVLPGELLADGFPISFFYYYHSSCSCCARMWISHPGLVGGPQSEAVCGTREQTTHSALQLWPVVDLCRLGVPLAHLQTEHTLLAYSLRYGGVYEATERAITITRMALIYM